MLKDLAPIFLALGGFDAVIDLQVAVLNASSAWLLMTQIKTKGKTKGLI